MGKSKDHSEMYIIGIGTNDVLLPYLRSASLFWFLRMSLRCRLMRCVEDDEIFCREYRKILALLYKKNKQVVLFGMPFINLKNFPHARLIKRNKCMEALAEKYHCSLVDVYGPQKEKIRAERRRYTWKYRFLMRVADAAIMTLLPFTKDYFVKIRGLATSVDGVHFNAESASVLAAKIEKHIFANRRGA